MAHSLTNALKKILEYQQTGEHWSVFSLYGSSYAALFCAQYLEYVKQQGVPLVYCNLEDREKADIIAEWSMSFLGQNKMYWCSDLSLLDATKKKYVLSFLKSYTGPHKIIIFNDQPLHKEHSLELPSHLTQSEFKELFQFFYAHELVPEKMVKKVYQEQQKIPLDTACVMMGYMSVFDEYDQSSSLYEQYFSDLLEKVGKPEQSLFMLSQCFFAQEYGNFFAVWQAVASDFPAEFWTTYWSEQLWQASLFLAQVKELGPLGARKGINRLPFSFMQRDWKKYTARELCAAHNFLYSVDYGLKNGCATHGLELFFEHFLHGTFAKK